MTRVNPGKEVIGCDDCLNTKGVWSNGKEFVDQNSWVESPSKTALMIAAEPELAHFRRANLCPECRNKRNSLLEIGGIIPQNWVEVEEAVRFIRNRRRDQVEKHSNEVNQFQQRLRGVYGK